MDSKRLCTESQGIWLGVQIVLGHGNQLFTLIMYICIRTNRTAIWKPPLYLIIIF